MVLEDDFATMLAAARKALPWAWERIYRDLSPHVAGYMRANGVRDPEDVTADVFVNVVEGIDRFEGDAAHFRSWVFVMAHRRMIDDRRRRTRSPEAPLTYERLHDAQGTVNVENEALSRLSTSRVAGMIERCAPDQREVLSLRVLGGLTLAETADVLGKSLSAVKGLQRRGFSTIARQLTRQGVTL